MALQPSNRNANATSSATFLNADFYMNNFYRYNRKAFKASTRQDYNSTELSYEDSRALKRAVAKLGSYDYSKAENGDNIASTVEAFVETYNHTMESTSSKDADTYRQNRQLKVLSEKYGDELKDIGITVEKDGKLSLSENVLKASSFKKVKEVFDNDSDYISGVRKIARRMHATSYDEVYEMMTGCGGRLNIVL